MLLLNRKIKRKKKVWINHYSIFENYCYLNSVSTLSKFKLLSKYSCINFPSRLANCRKYMQVIVFVSSILQHRRVAMKKMILMSNRNNTETNC